MLPGISLAVLFRLAAQLDVAVTHRDLTIDDLVAADEVLLASTSICILPVVAVDGKNIGDGRPGVTFSRLLAAWSDMVGVDIAQQARRCAV